MSAIRPLDAVRHAALRYDRLAGAATRRIVPLGRSEMALAAADAPLCFAKDAQTGRFDLVALVGLVAPVNLFCIPGGLHATYQPHAAALTPFRLDPAGAGGLAVDETDPAVGAHGAALFEGGGPAPLLAELRAMLAGVVDDIAASRALAAGYARRALLRPLDITLVTEDAEEQSLDGLYIVDEEALASLDDAAVIAMHHSDELAPAAVMAASLAQVERLRQLHNARHASPITSFRLAIRR